MKPWAIWMIRHRMVWILKGMAIAAYPVYLLCYCGDAFHDVLYTVRAIDGEKTKSTT